MLQHVKQSVSFDGGDNSFKAETPFSHEQGVFGMVPDEWAHAVILARLCA
jgi:hypothetical protein